MSYTDSRTRLNYLDPEDTLKFEAEISFFSYPLCLPLNIGLKATRNRRLPNMLITYITQTSKGIFSKGAKYFRWKFEIDGTGTKEDADYKNRTAKSVNILICFTFLRPF